VPRLNPRTLLALAPAFALVACGSAREAELEKQLAEARATIAEETAARKKAERIAESMQTSAQNDDLADFYGSDSREKDANSDLQPHEPEDSDNAAPPAAEAAPAAQDAPAG
jgi:Tfp pilus assembly protein PilP